MFINRNTRRKPEERSTPTVSIGVLPRLQSISNDTYKRLITNNPLLTLIPCLGDNIYEHINAVNNITTCLLNDNPPPVGYGRNMITIKDYLTNDFYFITDPEVFDYLRGAYYQYFDTLSSIKGEPNIKIAYHDVMVEHIERIIELTK